MSGGSRIQVTRRRVPGGCRVGLTGDIDHEFDGSAFVGVEGVVVIDLDGVRRVTSFGARQWTRAIAQIDREFCAFVQCRPAVVAQFNMIPKFGGNGTLVSLYAPFVCLECEEEVETLIDLRRQYDVVRSATLPKVTCPKCGAECSFDDIPESYFAFAASRPPPIVPALAQQLIDESADSASEPFSARKDIVGTITAARFSGTIDERVRWKRVLGGMDGRIVLVLADATEATPEGVRAFRGASSELGEDWFLACVPRVVVEAMTGDDPLRARVISLWIDEVCSACGSRRPREIPLSAVRDHGLDAVICSECGSSVRDLPNHWVSLAAEKFGDGGANVPRDVREYLDGRTERTTIRPQVLVSTESDSRYRVLQRIGAGGMGEVYLALQNGPEGFRKKVVLKRVLPQLAERPEILEMFIEEARLASRISHPNVTQILDLFESDGGYVIAMEYVRGWDLGTILVAAKRGHARMPTEIACRLLSDVALGVHAGHECEDGTLCIVHRDISPRNVLVSSDGVAKITDFGVAKATDSWQATQPGELKGKPRYVPPELLNGLSREVDARTDIFALGVVLLECLLGKHPVEVVPDVVWWDDVAKVLEHVRPLRGGEQLAEVIGRAVARDRTKRTASARELHLALESVLFSLGNPATQTHVAEWVRDALVHTSLLDMPQDPTMIVSRASSAEITETTVTGVVGNPSNLDFQRSKKG